MTRTFKTLATVLICGLIMTACGGDGESKSGLPANDLIGNLPALYADYNLFKDDLKTEETKAKEKLMADGYDIKKATALEAKWDKERDEKSAALEEDVKAEWAKLDGKDVPFSTSEAFNKLNMKVNSVKFSAEKRGVVIDLVAKNDVVINIYNMGEYWAVCFKTLAKDGSVIYANNEGYVIDPSEVNGFGGKTFKAGQVLDDDLSVPLHVSREPEKYVNFASIEFITKAER